MKLLIFKDVSLAHIKTIHEVIAQYRSSPTMESTRLSFSKGYMTQAEGRCEV